MKKFLLIGSFLITSTIFLGQTKLSKSKLKQGDKVIESIINYTDSVNTKKYELPNKAFTILYRFGDVGGTKDNFDSLQKVINHVYRLNKYFGPGGKKRSRLTCFIYVNNVNKEAPIWREKINAWNKQVTDSLVKTERAGFNFSRPWEILFLKSNKPSQSSVLAAGKVSILNSDGTLLSTSPSVQAFKFQGERRVKGKLLTERSGKKSPVANALVFLFKSGTVDHDSAYSNVYGDFDLSAPDETADYNIVVKSHPKDVDNIILATQEGQEISRLKKTPIGFEYKLIPAEVIRLTEMEEKDDIMMLFSRSKVNENLKVTENILYALGQFNIEEPSIEILDKVVRILKENPKVKLEVISHTDSQGDDESNMVLSDKRSNSVIDYLVSKEIEKARLSGIGKGETEIRNRCTNGIDCTDKEHGYNRRTEFKFIKN